MPKHILRLILLFVCLGVLAVTVRNYLVDKSFYEYGHYRGNAVAEIARDKPKFQGMAYCKSCHAKEYAEWSNSPHDSADIGKFVKCEVCHGPGGGRDPQQGYINAATGPVHPHNLKLGSRELCPVCHEKIAGRPLQQKQVVIEDHAGTLKCTLCHNPHAPRTFIGTLAAPEHPGDAVAGKKKTEACAACHGAGGISNANLPGPTLAGQNQTYLVQALTAYKTGKRSNPIMSGMAAQVNDGDIADIAAYYASQKCEVTLSAASQIEAARKAGAAVCTNCHGANGVGVGSVWPNLAGQSKDYIASALKAYAAGERSNAVMSGLAKGMTDARVENLAAHYANASCK